MGKMFFILISLLCFLPVALWAQSPRLTVNPLELDFGKLLNTLNIEIKNSGSGTLEWSAQPNPDEDWLTLVGSRNGSLGADESTTLRVDVSRSGLPDGVIYGEILISSNAGNAVVDVIVEVGTAPTTPVLALQPPVLDFNTGLTELKFTIKNRGVGTLSWSAAKNPVTDWITSVSPASGALNSMAETEVTVQISRSGLADAEYSGYIQINSNAGNAPIEVEMIVGEPPAIIRANVGGTDYTASGGDAFATDRPYHEGAWGHVRGHYYSISNNIGNTIDDLMYQTEVFWLDAYRFDVPNGNYTVVLHFAELYYNYTNGRVFSAYLENQLVLDHFDIYKEVGFRNATTRTISNVLVNDSRLDVEFEHFRAHAKLSAIEIIRESTSQPRLAFSPGLLDFGASETSLAFQIQNSGTGSLDWTATGNQPWITSIVPAQGSLPGGGTANVIITVDRQNLANGLYDGTIDISTNGGPGQIDLLLAVGNLTAVYRMNAGATSNFTDQAGNVWNRDQAYTAGSGGYVGGSTYSATHSIENTTDDVLYQSERYEMSAYRFDLANGNYEVLLHFAEIYHTAANRRVFSVKIENDWVLSDYDIFADVGANAATKKLFHVPVTDGRLGIEFSATIDAAKISAIEILSTASTPLLAVSPTALDFGAVTTSLTFEIINSGAGTLTWDAAEAPDATWITGISPVTGSLAGGQSQMVAVTVDRAGLSTGNYSGTIHVSSNGGEADVLVQMTVTATAPEIAVSPAALAFSATAGGSNPASQNILITNTGGGTLAWSAAESPEQTWLTLTGANGGSGAAVTVSVNITGMNAGSYSTNVRISDPGAGNSPVDVPVTLTITSPAGSADILAEWEAEASPSLPNSGWQITTNAGETCIVSAVKALKSPQPQYQLNYAFEVPQGITAVYVFAEIDVNGSGSDDSFWMSMNGSDLCNWKNLAGLGDGWKRAWIYRYGSDTQHRFAVSTGTNILNVSPRADDGFINWLVITTNPNLDIQNYVFNGTTPPPVETPQIAVSPAALNFATPVNGAQPASQSITITNSGSGTLAWTATESPERSWLSLDNSSGGSGEQIEVAVDVNGLAVGTYTSAVRISDPAATNNPVDVPITLVISAEPGTTEILADFEAESSPSLPNSGWQVTTNGGAGCVKTLINSRTSANSQYRLDYLFEVPPGAGPVYVFAEIDVNGSGSDDSFWISMNGGDLCTWKNLEYLGDGWRRAWVFNYGSDTQHAFRVNSGTNTLNVYPRVDGAFINWLVVTTDPNLDLQSFVHTGTLAKSAESYPEAPVALAPVEFRLRQNYPNPFNPETKISFSLPDARAVNLSIFNALGQLVAELVNGALPAGEHLYTWEARDLSGDLLPSGPYFYRIQAGEFIETRRMLLVK